ncbi:hypothetical protein NBRC110019_26720 [Neptunitalea chrysea]|uniref:DUF4294 domain-containing protein n=1 Tax=Neptunitalea chrysea TaxID=1647581 RepID=A0A9W6EW10_9FLAO|nr:DUF4294 domain-containing protein [Neptunitalea chrysea]GLB53631.1 hypothetical protein NBRC110019_26720 [Neptunitalea chrysea]
MRTLLIYIGIVLGISFGHAQVEDGGEEYIDSLDEDLGVYIELDEVVLFEKLKFTSHKKKVDYYILRRKVHKVYPYAKLAAERLTNMNNILDTLDSNRLRKRYIKRMQEYIENEFTEELKKMTRTEGEILIKLIHRQTGETAYSLIKEYRSGWKAFWYNTTASMFKLTLKEEYNPRKVKQDYLIEDILQRAFAVGTLEKQKDVLGLDFDKLSKKWKN